MSEKRTCTFFGHRSITGMHLFKMGEIIENLKINAWIMDRNIEKWYNVLDIVYEGKR